MKRLMLVLAYLMASYCLSAQLYYFPGKSSADSLSFSNAIKKLSGEIVSRYTDDDPNRRLNNLFRLQLLQGNYAAAIETIVSLRNASTGIDSPFTNLLYIQHELYAKAMSKTGKADDFKQSFTTLFGNLVNRLDDKSALHIATAFISLNGIAEFKSTLQSSLLSLKDKDSLTAKEAIELCKKYYMVLLYESIEPLAIALTKADDDRRYIISDSLLIKTKEGIQLSAIVVRKRAIVGRQPTALAFTIYAEDFNLQQAKIAASYGYVGMVALTRGKALSPGKPIPYEYESVDVNAVIDWISHQPWSNGKVGMYGGSYNGFSQWAAAKHLHPALKTIVPYVAAIPGLGVPMENNVFLNANYGWAFYATNTKYLDDKTYYDPQRWSSMQERWYASGRPYNKIDSVDGTPNTWLQRWLKHPAFDKYWQNMIPYKQDYANINIPVLTITGYYDDGQISAIHYLKEHYKYNSKANHYLLIGPYDHLGAQRGGTAILRDYTVDPVALINTREITFQWLDHILKNGPRPSILKDKINYELMGANQWRHAPSLKQLQDRYITFYLSNSKSGSMNLLSQEKPTVISYLDQTVDLADRKTSNNNSYYPYPIIGDSLVIGSGLSFISEPFEEPLAITGTFFGELEASINKKDMDIGVVLYEILPDGRYFHLSYFLGRASYAKDMSQRKLLVPGKKTAIPFERTRMVSRQLSKGSRLLVVLDINKNEFTQVNYGTGKDVSIESIEDAKEPLRIKWFTDSFIRIPVSP